MRLPISAELRLERAAVQAEAAHHNLVVEKLVGFVDALALHLHLPAHHTQHRARARRFERHGARPREVSQQIGLVESLERAAHARGGLEEVLLESSPRVVQGLIERPRSAQRPMAALERGGRAEHARVDALQPRSQLAHAVQMRPDRQNVGGWGHLAGRVLAIGHLLAIGRLEGHQVHGQ